MSTPAPPAGARRAIVEQLRALGSRRTLAVTLLSFSSGLPLGLVWKAIPDWMRDSGIDIRYVGLFTLAQAPWSFKVLWSPLLDRFSPPIVSRLLGRGRMRAWAIAAQIALAIGTLALAGVGHDPDTPWVAFALALAIAVAAASQDIAIDAYAVEILERREQGAVVGLRTGAYRAAMFLAGGFAITAAAAWSWPVVVAALAAVYVAMMAITAAAPETDRPPARPTTLGAAVWSPLVELLGRPRAIEILAFVVLYKLCDNLSQSLLRPFLVDMGYDAFDRGLGTGSIAVVLTLVGSFAGGLASNVLGLGRALWVFGFLQVFSNVGYLLIIQSGTSRPMMYGALGFETLTTGLGTGAFMVLLLRMTERRFSATQYAVFSSLFAVPRIFAGPVTGYAVHALGWTTFFWLTMAAGIPGLVMLARFVPWGRREIELRDFSAKAPAHAAEPRKVLAYGIGGFVVGAIASVAGLALLGALRAVRAEPGSAFDYAGALRAAVRPAELADGIALAGAVTCAALAGLFTAAVVAARGGDRDAA